ncbi:MAG TPA: hypothetical protein VFY23_15325 [Candidatus Limnocylindrales bacterium]|nr:hypothetical protein [Candidatus Limnocylindrales bacterium]
MDMLNDLLGGSRKQPYEDLATRYQSGPPYDTIGDDEAYDRYHELGPNLSRDDYRQSAEEAFSRMSPQERAEFSHWLRTKSKQQGVTVQDYDLNDDGTDDRMQQNPGELAEMTTRMRDQNPNILEQLLGKGGTGGRFDNPIAKIALAGITAFAAQKLMGSRR